jgi:hypothetical protein
LACHRLIVSSARIDFWEMVDVIDVLDAFEAKRKRAAKPVFEVAQWAIGGGLCPRDADGRHGGPD